jgi:hypothetical protein
MRRFRYLLTVLIAAAAILVLPGPAHAVPTAEGYVWAHQPDVANYVVNTGYEYNSTGGQVQIVREAVGAYRVRFAGMAVSGGVAHATAYGSTNSDFCTVQSWVQSGADLLLRVRCFDGTGAATDTRFVANFTNRQSAAGTLLYLWANQATPAMPYEPSTTYSFDSAGGPITVERLGVGRYRIEATSITDTYPAEFLNGHVDATAYGTSPVRCEVLEPQPTDPPSLPVSCYDVDGAWIDSRFTLTFSQGRSLLGTNASHASAVVHPNPAAPPDVLGWSNDGGAPTATELAEGWYRVTFPGLSVLNGHVSVGMFGSPPAYCNVGAWWSSGGSELITVGCFDAATHDPTAAFFTVGFVD